MNDALVLNWFGEDDTLTEGLREEFRGSLPPRPLKTIRLGTKYANAIEPGDQIAISISDDSNNPNVIGLARVLAVKKGTIEYFGRTMEGLENNIGAGHWERVLRDMQWVYDKANVKIDSVVTIIEFVPEKTA
ncbi:MAG: hypothetical protein R3251_00985 [Candidatus Spechtbacterales bacterium]|nr:hypothetical protein [Candidatus Spechtbacterales bacterium]